jgi:predicted dehydrogenase
VDSQQLGWGLVGPGRIAATQIAPAIADAPNSALISVVSRDLGRATEFAKAHGAAQALDSYPAMLADPAVQAVYIATPNALHAGQVIAAAEAGKHVLCDKPLAVTVPDARRCVEECRAAAPSRPAGTTAWPKRPTWSSPAPSAGSCWPKCR